MQDGVPTRRRRISPPKRLITIILGVAAAIFGLLIGANENMRPALADLAEARITSIAVTAMNEAIMESMDNDSSYASLVAAQSNGQKVYMLQADARRMNILAANCCAAAQKRIAEIGEQGVSVPLGTISGITYLSGKGPGIRVTFTPAGSVVSEFCSELVSSGINQSLYRVNIRLTANVKLIMPGVSRSIKVHSEAAIAESIIVGDVPDVYTNVASEEDMLNLIPTEPVN